MEVVNARSALLCNYEVVLLLKELESDHLARAKTALRIKKEEEQANLSGVSSSSRLSLTVGLGVDDVCENLRTVEFEAIEYLTAEYQPTRVQCEESITKLVKGLEAFDLTKAEKLQIVNLAPSEPVELYVIVEELEDRLADKMDDVLQVIRSSLVVTATAPAQPSQSSTRLLHIAEEDTKLEYPVEIYDEWKEAPPDDLDDLGHGAGIEGDLEMDDD